MGVKGEAKETSIEDSIAAELSALNGTTAKTTNNHPSSHASDANKRKGELPSTNPLSSTTTTITPNHGNSPNSPS